MYPYNISIGYNIPSISYPLSYAINIITPRISQLWGGGGGGGGGQNRKQIYILKYT